MANLIRFLSIKFLLVIPVICIFYSCEKRRDYLFETQLNVVCILRNDEPYPVAIIDRSYKIDEFAEYDLEDALVYISGPAIVETLFYSGDYNYFQALKPITIQAESVYHLSVCAPGFESVTGLTQIPGRFQIISPLWYDTIGMQDSIIFTKSKGGAIYNIIVSRDQMGGDYCNWYYLPQASNDTILKVPIMQFYEYITESGPYEFWIVAHDSNYFNYEFHFGSEPPAYGIENGTGLFGSAWKEAIVVNVNLGLDN